MSGSAPIPLIAVDIDIDEDEYDQLRGWPYADKDAYIRVLLETDIPRRVIAGECCVWIYKDPEDRVAGFGTIDVCLDYARHTDGERHTYLPLLAVNPALLGRGFGRTILEHLIGDAARIVREGNHFPALFLDVYVWNEKAIRLYERNGFGYVDDEPIPDPDRPGDHYVVMARRVTD